MAKVYITNSFKKEIRQRKPLLKELIRKIKKHNKGSKNLIDIFSPGRDLKVLKAYLDSKRTRAAVLLRISKSIYIPFFLAQKESKLGWNLSKYSEDELLNRIERVQTDIENDNYEEFEL